MYTSMYIKTNKDKMYLLKTPSFLEPSPQPKAPRGPSRSLLKMAGKSPTAVEDEEPPTGGLRHVVWGSTVA